MDFARLLGKPRPDIVGVLGDVVAQLFELFAQFAFRRRHDGNRRIGRSRWRCRLRRQPWRLGHFSMPKARRHDRLLDLGGAADWASYQRALDLLVVGRRVLEPALESMALFAIERIADHSGARTACRWVGSAIGSMSSKRRP